MKIKFPPIRVRGLIVYGALAIGALLTALGIAAGFLVARFDAIELQQTSVRATRALRALEADLNELATSTRDYAERAEVRQFVAGGDRQALDATFTPTALTGREIDVIALMSADGALLYGAQVDSARRELRGDLPPSLVRRISEIVPLATKLRQYPAAQHLLTDRGRLIGFDLRDVADGKDRAAGGMVLFCGRFLEADEVARLRDASQLPVILHGPDAAQKLTTTYDLHDDSTAARVQSAQTLTGYVRLTDWQGRAVGIISFDAQREIGSAGRHVTAWIIGTVASLLLVLAGIMVLLARRIHLYWQNRLLIERRHRNILGALNEIVALVDPHDGRILETNDAWWRALGHTPEERGSVTLEDIFIDLSMAELLAVADAGGNLECLLRTRDDRLIDAEINVYRLEEGSRSLMCIAARDISRRRRTEQELRENQTRLAHVTEHDALTGLPNRQYLFARLPRLLSQVSSEQRSLALLYVDIDHFKNINDSSSHGWGDQLLKIIARRLQNQVGAEDIVLRLGGDEFLVIAIIPTAANASSTALAKGEKLLAALRTPIVHETQTVAVTASIGIATFPNDGRDGEALLKHADIALHQAKERGRDCCRVFASDMNARVIERVALEQSLRRAIDTEQIFLEYQPLVDLQTGLLVSFEALARWQHPEVGRVSPARFIPVAEETGLLIPMGQQIVHTVIMQLREWRDSGLVLAPVAINVSPVQFERTDFVAFVHETARHYGIDLRFLSFEVTESALLQDSDRCIVAINALRSAGSRVYIDDFGTGFSNLSYLKTLPIDAVKIDQSFVRNIDTDPNDAAIVASVVSVSRQLRLDTVAEGIETAAQAARVRDLGCRYGQGYFFSKPLPVSYCRSLLEQLGTVRRLTETVKQRAFGKAAGY